MITVGVDLAAQAKKTAVATVEWTVGRATVTVDVDRSDEHIVAAAAGATKVGIDCPFGWPEPFIDFITAHRDRARLAAHSLTGRKQLAYRLTDRVVVESNLGRPLSVSADLIGHAAMRAAGLLAALEANGYDADRAGAGLVVESYPAAALKRWALPSTQYKGVAGRDRRNDLVDGLRTTAPWLTFGDDETLCRRSDDALDAVICALIARAAATNRVTWPDEAQIARARTEGWIVVPTCELPDLICA